MEVRKDSSGGLVRDNLPRAKIYSAWDGMKEFLTQNSGHPPKPFFLTAESWAYFRDHFEPACGHHPGSAGVRIRTDHGTVGILETAFVQENVDLEVPIGIAEDASRCREVIRSYRQTCELVVAGHEPSAPRLIERFFAGRE